MFSVYSTETGLFTGQRLSGEASFIETNVPPGCAIVAGEHDYLCRRVELESGRVVAWQPSAPADDEWRTWSWNESTERWIAAPTAAAVAIDVRRERDRRLAACDWVSVRAYEAGQPVPPAWASYRSALRQISEQPGFPSDVQWPVPPEA